jgi:Putative lumazine-binding
LVAGCFRAFIGGVSPRNSSGMKTTVAFFALLLGFSRMAAAVDSAASEIERVAVVRVVQGFFDALQHKDGEALRALCQPGAQFISGRETPEGFKLKSRPVEVDVARRSESKDRWLERMWTPTVHVEGRIAVVWTRYDFHNNGILSHNGTDCFTLMKTDAGWKIVSLAYSVEPGTQTENPAGPPN